MLLYKLPKSATNIIDNYLKLKAAEDGYVRCPYFKNPKSGKEKWGLDAYSGKGSPKDIEAELRIIEKLEGKDFAKLSENEIREIMKKRKLGIECSGFITRVLDGLTRDVYKKPVYSFIKYDKSGIPLLFAKMRPYSHINVLTLINPLNSRKIKQPREVLPGDIIEFNSSVDHAIIITSVEKDDSERIVRAAYAHSILEEFKEGVKTGLINFQNSDTTKLNFQKWEEWPNTGNVIINKGNPSIYRLYFLETLTFAVEKTGTRNLGT